MIAPAFRERLPRLSTLLALWHNALKRRESMRLSTMTEDANIVSTIKIDHIRSSKTYLLDAHSEAHARTVVPAPTVADAIAAATTNAVEGSILLSDCSTV